MMHSNYLLQIGFLMKRRVIGSIATLMLVWIVAAGVLGALAVKSLLDGRAQLTAITNIANETSLRDGSLESALREGAGNLESAHDKLRNPVLMPVRKLPWVGNNVRSAIDLSQAGSRASEIAADAVQDVKAVSLNDPSQRAASLHQIAVICADSDARLRTVNLGPRDGLAGPLRDAREKAVSRFNAVDKALIMGGAGSEALATMVERPGDYLLVAANNAEMRNGSGMFLQAGLLKTGNSALQVQDMRSVGELNQPDGVIKWPDEMVRNWGWLDKEGYMQNLMLSPRFDVNAPIAKSIWESNDLPTVDGVIVIDVEMLRAMLAVTGPVTVDGSTLNESNIAQAMMLDQYKTVSSDSIGANANRREKLSAVAKTTFDRFNQGGWDVSTAAQNFGRAAQGRHVMIWSTDAELNKKWAIAGIAGVTQSDSTMVSTVNLGTNKLDQFLKTEVAMTTQRSDKSVDQTLTVRVANTAPADGPAYVLGPGDRFGLAAGGYRGMLAFTLPGDVTDTKFDGDLPVALLGRDGTNQSIATAIDIPRGNTQTFVLHYSRPLEATTTTVEPSAHLPVVDWAFGNENWQDSTPKTLSW